MRLLTSLDEGKMQQAGAQWANNASHLLLPVIGSSAKLSPALAFYYCCTRVNMLKYPVAKPAGAGESSIVKEAQQDKGTSMSDEIQDNGGGSGFGWFLVGLGIGAAIGVLYAPQAGTDTRETLAESARERAEYLKHKSREAAAHVNTYVDAGKEQFGDYVERGKNAVATGRSQVEDYVERGRKVVAKHASKVSAAVDAGKSAYTATTSPVDGQI
jgi:gas vesicle protein